MSNYFAFQNLRHDAVVAPLPGTRRKNNRQGRGNFQHQRPPNNPSSRRGFQPQIPPPPAVFDPLTALGQHLVNSMVSVGAPASETATVTRKMSTAVESNGASAAEPSKNVVAIPAAQDDEREAEASPRKQGPTLESNAAGIVTSVLTSVITPAAQHGPASSAKKGQYSEKEVQRRIESVNTSAEVVRIVSGFKQHSWNITTTTAAGGNYGSSGKALCSLSLCRVYCTAIEKVLLLQGSNLNTGSAGGKHRHKKWMLLSAEARSNMNEWVSALHGVVVENPLQLDAAAVLLVMRGATAIGLRDMKLYRAVMRELQSRPGKLDISRWTLLLGSLVEALHLQASHVDDDHHRAGQKAAAVSTSSTIGIGMGSSGGAARNNANNNVANVPLSLRTRGLRPHYNLSMNRVSASLVPAVSGRYRQSEAVSALGMSSGLAKMGVSITKAETTFMKFASDEILAKEMEIAALSPKTIAALLSSLSALGHKSLPLLAALGKAALQKQHQFDPDDWSRCLNVFIRFGVPLRDDCTMRKRPRFVRDWMIPPKPKRPVPMSQC